MTFEEALKRIKVGDPFSAIYNSKWKTAEWEEAKQKAKEAIEKQIPKKPKRMEYKLTKRIRRLMDRVSINISARIVISRTIV